MRRLSRRQVLRGAGGFSLALPWLPSLLPRGADAASSPLAQPRFVAICTEHGGLWEDNFHPIAGQSEQMTYAGHAIRRSALQATHDAGRSSLSPIMSADSTVLTDELVAKMNVIRGLDVPFYIGHHRGGHLGNWAANDGNGEDGAMQMGSGTPTIDQVLAWSDTFYADLSTILERSLIIGNDISWRWTNLSDPTPGDVQPSAPEFSSLALFNRIFVPEEEEQNPRPPVVDRVMDNYQSLRQSDKRLSAGDRVRLDAHIERIDELQRRLAVAVSCGDIPVPSTDSESLWGDPSFPVNPTLNAEFWQLFNDVILAAFACGTSRIAVLRVTDNFSSFVGDWHQDIAHQAHLPDGTAQQEIADGNMRTFEDVFMDLVGKLDIDEGDGTTILDNTLVQWTQESGQMTHESIDSPVVTAGSAGGCLSTGQFLDYRNLNNDMSDPYDGTPVRLYGGLIYNQYLGTVLQSMGLSPAEYEVVAGRGYPDLFIGEGRDPYYPSAVQDAMGEMLPWLPT